MGCDGGNVLPHAVPLPLLALQGGPTPHGKGLPSLPRQRLHLSQEAGAGTGARREGKGEWLRSGGGHDLPPHQETVTVKLSAGGGCSCFVLWFKFKTEFSQVEVGGVRGREPFGENSKEPFSSQLHNYYYYITLYKKHPSGCAFLF